MDSTVEDYEIVLVEDGSTDRTFDIARAFHEKNQRLRIFRNERNLNVGISSRRAIQEASKEFLFWQTVDWGYDISNLRLFLEYLQEYDVVQGVRRGPVQVKIRILKPIATILRLFGIKHLTKRSDTIPKAVVSLINYLLIRILFRVPLSDFQNVSFYRTEWIQSLEYEAKSSFVNPEALIKAYWQGMSIKEVPINFLPREKGSGKGVSVRTIATSVQDILSLWFKWVVLGRRGKVRKGRIHRITQSEWRANSVNLDITAAKG
jgi:glycosyltransferase involved in cell wall biosynthesis